MKFRKIIKSTFLTFLIIFIISFFILYLKSIIFENFENSLYYAKIAHKKAIRDLDKSPFILALIGKEQSMAFLMTFFSLGIIFLVSFFLGYSAVKEKLHEVLKYHNKIEIIGELVIVPFGDSKRGIIINSKGWPNKYFNLPFIEKTVLYTGLHITISLVIISFLSMIITVSYTHLTLPTKA